jgi:hypothetical protein
MKLFFESAITFGNNEITESKNSPEGMPSVYLIQIRNPEISALFSW